MIFLKDVDQNEDYTDIEILNESPANTFILWANSESPDLNYTIHPNFNSIDCFPITEPSIIQDINNMDYYLSVQCLDFDTAPNYEYGIKMIKADNAYFINDEWSDFILSPNTWCTDDDGYDYPGWVAGTLIIHHND